ncbi:hypothetical protein [Effusibacillus lacus]|uniref:DUF5672 domain-containing protein n=1 Tax=Effusibacillus lacus TaxID=1348429 RepID=A0A292YLP3_9BACL|nr:hypothetical protein [Effusibacillus lacus]TCS71202.1 hypothetical protein EDD64_1271 [Effusibacillus lacus]GAX89829.1 hypothetical protein EFBL_1454 [Effusibacillus lacus]
MICFSLVAHENEDAVLDQVKNIHHFVGKDHMIVLYNGGPNKKFGQRVCKKYKNVRLCPYSRPLIYRKTGRVLYDVARWLEEKKVKYDYLVYLESDTMFIKSGFDKYLKEKMKGYDFIGQNWTKYDPLKDKPKSPGAKMMFDDWKRWKRFFETNYFCKTSNPFQTYKYKMIKKILNTIDREKLERLLSSSPVESLGEMIFPTFAEKEGARIRRYPRSFLKYNRWKPERLPAKAGRFL